MEHWMRHGGRQAGGWGRCVRCREAEAQGARPQRGGCARACARPAGRTRLGQDLQIAQHLRGGVHKNQQRAPR